MPHPNEIFGISISLLVSFKISNFEISKGCGLLVKIWKLYYADIEITMKMNSDDKFNVVIMADVFAGANSEQPAEIPRVPHTPRLLKWRSQGLL
jgi:hypothetical protein